MEQKKKWVEPCLRFTKTKCISNVFSFIALINQKLLRLPEMNIIIYLIFNIHLEGLFSDLGYYGNLCIFFYLCYMKFELNFEIKSK